MAKQPKSAPAKKPAAKKPATDWVAVLRSGAAGVRKWNTLTAAQRRRAKLQGADLSGTNLTDANLTVIRATGADFRGAALTGVRFDRAVVEKANFEGADLRGAIFFHSSAAGANFRTANLAKACFLRAECRRAAFGGADLSGAEFVASQLHGSDFGTATLTGAQWDGAEFDAKTKWPSGFVVPGEVLWAGKGTDPRLTGKGKKAAAHDINGLMARLHATIDEKRMGRVLDMLRKERNQIFSEVEPTLVRGVVRSQRDIDTVYSCVLTEDGTYSCCTPDLKKCMGLSDEPCKHLLVLLLGLARAGQLDPVKADAWVVAAEKKNPRWNKTVQGHMADSLLKYKGVTAGEIDWRPTETIPEDFYAM